MIMRENYNGQLRKKVLATAITTSLGIASAGIPSFAIADTYVWGSLGGLLASDKSTCMDADTLPSPPADAATIAFTMIDPAGAALANSSIPAKGNNQFQTITCGTLTYDTVTESGTAEIGAFDFFSGSLPAVAKDITLQKVPAGLDDGSGNLLLANMLFDYNGVIGIPVSISYDAQGILGEMDGTPTSFTLNADGSINTANDFTGTGASPDSDGTYVGNVPGTVPGFSGTPGYLGLGPTPLATTDFDTTNVAGCTFSSCLNINPSADIAASSAVADNTPNVNRFDLGTGAAVNGMGGNPMQDGPFSSNNANFDFTSLKLVSFTDTTVPVLTMDAHVTPPGTTPLTLTVGVDTYTEPGATCTDAAPLNTNLDGSVVIGGDTVVDVIGTYNVTYDCQDASGNDAGTETRVVNVVALGVPSITLSGTTPITHECATAYTDAGATASDPEDGDISASIIATVNNGVDLTKGIINEGTLGAQTIDYDVQDLDLNSAPTVTRDINVVDSTNPVITLQGSDPDDVNSSTPQNPATYTDPTADVTDSCDTVGFPMNINASTGTVDMVVPDTGAETLSYNLGYTSTDASANTANLTREVRVTRSQPVITLVGGGVVLNVGDSYTEQGMDITDAQDGNLAGITASGTSSGLTYTVDTSAVDTSTAGEYTVTYDVTDSDSNLGTQVERTVTVGVFASASNFTMLDGQGNVFGGTNDVIFDWDESENLSESDLNFNMTISSQGPFPFFGFVWTAHHTRVFGPGTYSFDTGCTVAEIEATGCPAGSAASSGATMTMTVEAGQVGAHILFDWNTTDNIDVVNVWDRDGVWDQHGATNPKNQLHNGLAGSAPDPTTTWKLVSTDVNGDGVNSSPMVDGPFQGFYANFSASPGDTAPPPPPYTGTAPDTSLDDSILASMNIWGLIAGLVALLGFRRSSKK